MFKQFKVARSIRSEWEHMWQHPDAYRPGTPVPHPPSFDAMKALAALSNYARQVRMTSGDAGMLGVELVKQVDATRSYADAFDNVMEQIADGRLLTVTGRPMRNYATAEAVSTILELAANAARAEAFNEYVSTELSSQANDDVVHPSGKPEGTLRFSQPAPPEASQQSIAAQGTCRLIAGHLDPDSPKLKLEVSSADLWAYNDDGSLYQRVPWHCLRKAIPQPNGTWWLYPDYDAMKPYEGPVVWWVVDVAPEPEFGQVFAELVHANCTVEEPTES